MNEYPNIDFDDSFNDYQHRFRYPHRMINKIQGERIQINIILFLLTILTTYLVQGILYSISIVSILFAHEMGHYLMCRKYGIDATLPYFIPIPIQPFGTMGAFIKMKSRIPNRRALFDVGVAGPLAGLAVTIPVLIIGLKNSTFIPQAETQTFGIYLGESLLFSKMAEFILGPEPQGFDTLLHPMAYAGWAGLFVTALNLLPIGQLDGGHIVYALFGNNSRYVSLFFIIAFSIICVFFYPGWILLIILLFIFGFNHPPPDENYTPLDRKRKLIGYFTFFIFIIAFIPVPFHFK